MNDVADDCTESLTLTVALGDRSYPIHIGTGVIDEAGTLIRPHLRQRRVVIVTDETVAPLYLDRCRGSLDRADIRASSVVLPAGEPTKDFGHLSFLCDEVLAQGIERATTLVALGGGVIGDITGFAAGILLRGLPFVQIPTTLLAQVDSSVGGKTGINTRQGKNLVGLFHQPVAVVADVSVLDSLDLRQVRAGYAEVVKYGLLGDANFFAWLESEGHKVIAGDDAARCTAVRVSCEAKAAIVSADEREGGVRALLNLGHTFGHALETETGFGDELLHGEAVAFGMVLAFRLSANLGLCDHDDVARVVQHLRAVGLPTRFTDLPFREWSANVLIAHMYQDKKVHDGRLTFILARGIGDAFVSRDVRQSDVEEFLEQELRR